MLFLYNIVVHIVAFFLPAIAFFSPKLKLFVQGRKSTFLKLQRNILEGDKVIWVHTASLGEFEQGLPILEKLKTTYPGHKILVTFFSPSGYEVKKNTNAAHLVTYLPLDTRRNAKKFIQEVQPLLAIFVKYEIWPHYLKALKKAQIPTLLIAARFTPKQIFFKVYGGFMRKALGAFSHIFVQDAKSEKLLKPIYKNTITLSGDTRFDRVAEILERDNSLAFMEQFKGNSPCFIAGSTWQEDESLIVNYINSNSTELKYVIAPHTIKTSEIATLKSAIKKKTLLYTEWKNEDLESYEVLIIDTIGILTKIYSYANIAYVGGGFATGLHNTLEPAAFGIPVIIGPQYAGFNEAEDLVARQGIIPIHDQNSFSCTLNQFLEQPTLRKTAGAINASYITSQKGASIQIMDHIRTLL